MVFAENSRFTFTLTNEKAIQRIELFSLPRSLGVCPMTFGA